MTIKSPLSWPFFRTTSSSSTTTAGRNSKLFGRSLPTGGQLPVPVVNMMRQLYFKGPFTLGIFRKSANARMCREIAAQLEEDPEFSLDDVPITVVGSVFKDFLRSLPNCLLDSRLLNRWIEAVTSPSEKDQREMIEKLLKKLPHEHLLLLKHVLCLLWHISQHSSVNKMCPNNLAVCIGPSLLSSSKIISPVRREEVSKNVPKVISYLIDHCPDLFGESVLTLLGPELQPLRPDSGAEVSDSSCHSMQENSSSTSSSSSSSSSSSCNTSNGSNTAPGPAKQILLLNDMTSSESDRSSSNSSNSTNNNNNNNKNKTSLSNLSRDSGLTASDTQLYSSGDQDDSAEDEDHKMFSLPHHHANIAISTPLLFTSQVKSKLNEEDDDEEDMNDENNLNIENNNSSKCVNRVLSSSIPHLLNQQPDDLFNRTFSYGKSIATGLNGSCQDVVRNRKRHQTLQSTPLVSHVHSPADHHHLLYRHNMQQQQQQATVRSLPKCTPSLVTFDNNDCNRLHSKSTPGLVAVNKSANVHSNHQMIHQHNNNHSQLHQQQQHHQHHHPSYTNYAHINNCVNRFFSKSVPHLNSIGFRNSLTFSPSSVNRSPRNRATRVHLHGWSYDLYEAQQRHNQSFPNDHYQLLQQDRCMYRCRATPQFISYNNVSGTQSPESLNPVVSIATTTPTTACLTPRIDGNNSSNNYYQHRSHTSGKVSGKRLSRTMHQHPASVFNHLTPSYSPFGANNSTPVAAASSSSSSSTSSSSPPSYQETMDRKKFVARLQSNVSLFRKISHDGVYEQFELRL